MVWLEKTELDDVQFLCATVGKLDQTHSAKDMNLFLLVTK